MGRGIDQEDFTGKEQKEGEASPCEFLTITELPYLRNLISVQSPRSTCSSSVVNLSTSLGHQHRPRYKQQTYQEL